MPFFEISFTGCSLVDDMKAKEFPVVTNSYLFIRYANTIHLIFRDNDLF
jgi:hypothetical protein